MSVNTRRFFMSGILLTSVSLFMRGVAVAFNSYLSRTVGAEGIGLFTLMMSVYGFAVTFATSGISLTVTRLVAAAVGEGLGKEARAVLRRSVVYALSFGGAAALVLFFGAEFFGTDILGDARTVSSLRLFAICLVPTAMSAVMSGYFIGVRRVHKNALCSVAEQGLRIGITIALITRAAPYGVEYACLAMVGGSALSEFIAFFFQMLLFIGDTSRILERGGEEVPGGWGRLFNMAVPVALSAYIRSALLTFEHVLIPKSLKKGGNEYSDALASYGILHGMAMPVILYPMALLTAFSGLLVPEFAECKARGEIDRMSSIASRALGYTLAFSCGSAVLLYTFSDEIGNILYGSGEAGVYIAILSVVIPVMYLDHVTDSVLKGIGEQVYSMWVNISDSLLSIILVVLVLPRLGVVGYAYVIIGVEIYNFTLSFIRLRRRVKIKLDIVGYGVFPLCAAFAASAGAQGAFSMNGSVTTAPWLFVKMIFALCIFIAVFLGMEELRAAAVKRRTA